MTENNFKELEDQLKALKALKDSYGWAIVENTLKDDIVKAAIGFADNPLMTEKEVDFRRGAMYAARGLLNVVPALIQRLENDLLMAVAQSTAATPNAMA